MIPRHLKPTFRFQLNVCESDRVMFRPWVHLQKVIGSAVASKREHIERDEGLTQTNSYGTIIVLIFIQEDYSIKHTITPVAKR